MMRASDAVREQGVIAIVRTTTATAAAASVATLLGAGVRVVEVSLVTPDALEVVRDAVRSAPPGILIGVGTVVSAAEVERSREAGASFVVSPIVREQVIRSAAAAGLDSFPGAATPTEALQALEWGATMVKLFPASLWSPAVLREVLAALPALETIPTGGVTPESAAEWIRAGAAGLGIGSALTRSADPAATVARLLAEIASARRSPRQ